MKGNFVRINDNNYQEMLKNTGCTRIIRNDQVDHVKEYEKEHKELWLHFI